MSHSRNSSPVDVLVVGAFHPELAPLCPLLGEGLRGTVGSRSVAAQAVGIGLPQATVGATLEISRARPQAVVLVGTCGAYPHTSLALGDVVVARRIALVEPAVAYGAAQFPEPMSVRIEADAAMRDGLIAAGATARDVATTLAVTVDDEVAARIPRELGTEAEHLEAHGVASACRTLGVPFAAVLGVANVVGSHAREQWRANHHAASEAAIRVVTAWIEKLAPESR
jgi:nucleoside phosphorylase